VPDRIDFSFADYVAARKSQAAARLREGSAYAYGGDLKVRSTLDRLKPVVLAMESAVRFWNTVGKSRLLGNALRVSDRQFPAIDALLGRAVDALQIARPALYVSPQITTLEAQTFGTSDEAVVVLGGPLVDHLTEPELLSVIGEQCGHIQNNHTTYLTTMYFLEKAANLVVRWAAKPAVLALRGWARRADITCDRAAMVCTRDLGASVSSLVKRALASRTLSNGVNVEEYLRQLDEMQGGPGRLQELAAAHPYLPKRVRAMRLFAETTFWKSIIGGPGGAESPGTTREECDAKVAELVSVL
jgi:Zn-dependent protease with chaperone function